MPTGVERYVLTRLEEKEEVTIAAYHKKKDALERKRELKKSNPKGKFYINHVIFDPSKLNDSSEWFSDTVIFHGCFCDFPKHYLFDAGNLDFDFEVGMAVDYVNGHVKDIKVIHRRGIDAWM